MQKFVWPFLALGLLLTACVIPSEEDPFERIPEEKIITISGEVFPFDVAVATSATHRVERDGKLVAYVASDVVLLNSFEGEEVEFDGFIRQEKMREIFWVQKVRIQKTDIVEVAYPPLDNIYESRNIAFEYPPNWSVSQAPDGVAYFSTDTNSVRSVFMTFSIETAKKSLNDPNILISNLTGIKRIEQDENGKEREMVELYGNTSKNVYKFILTREKDEYDKKKEFLEILNSIVEGEIAISELKRQQLKELAKREAEKIEAKKVEEIQAKLEIPVEYEPPVIEKKSGNFVNSLKNLFTRVESGAPIDDVGLVQELLVDENSNNVKIKAEVFKNLIDQRAFYYESHHYGFSMWSPYGYWFKNFGPSDTAITEIGFAPYAIAEKSQAVFILKVLEGVIQSNETETNGSILIQRMAEGKDKYFELSGSSQHRDAMKSIEAKLKAF